MNPIGLVVVFVFLAVIGGVAFFVLKEIKKNNQAIQGTVNTNNVETAQDFLPFKDVPSDVIDLGNHHYRMIIETSSTNYKLRTAQEQNIIDMTFQEFLNGLSHPITLYIQTRKLDMTKILEHISEENEKIIQEFPSIEEYANQYLNEMMDLETYVGNNIQKKKYVIVPYEEALTMDIPEEEKYTLSVKELTARTNTIAENLKGIGIQTKILNRNEVIELLYYTYHKDEAGLDETALLGYLNTFVEGNVNPLKEALPEDKIDMILYNAQMRLRYEVMEDLVNNKERTNKNASLLEKSEYAYHNLTNSRKLFEDIEFDYSQEDYNQNN